MKNCDTIIELFRSLPRRDEPWRIMEVCGTHTMSIARSGLRQLLPAGLLLVSGPGCPVCVTDQSYIDQVIGLAGRDDIIIATYGDMIRVPGSAGSLALARSAGANVTIVFSADRAVDLAIANPDKQVVFLGVGFETTAPASALAVMRAKRDAIDNFSVLSAHKIVPPALDALVSMEDVRIDGFLCPGHVSVILGYDAYENVCRSSRCPCVVAGFDPGQVIEGIERILRQIISSAPAVENVYPAVSAKGNITAQDILKRVFTLGDATWRALGNIPDSGLWLAEEFSDFDAAARFDIDEIESVEPAGCKCGEVITGRLFPAQCNLFGNKCTPRDPVGPCMVSSEGACAAAYKYERHR